MRYVVLMIGILIGTAGCNYKEREQAIRDKELALSAKELELSGRERNLALKELELQKQEHRLDSTVNDTTTLYNAALEGRWNVKMTCSETSCNGSAIGDTKTEVWDIYYNNHRIIAKAIDGNKLLRVYTGSWTGTELALNEDVDMSPGIPTTQMFVRLTMPDPAAMEGQREIVRQGDCKILYDLQLKKQ